MTFSLRLIGTVATLALGLGLTACGGSDSRSEPTAPPHAGASLVPPLRSDDGSTLPSVSAARPSDAAAWTANGRYATSAQAEQFAHGAGEDLIQVNVECCGMEAIEQAVGITWAVQAARNLPASQTRVLVAGNDLRAAAAVVNRLLAGGLREVWLVQPDSSRH